MSMEHCPYTMEQINEMQSVDIRTVDPAELRDIRDVKVNTALPKRERKQLPNTTTIAIE